MGCAAALPAQSTRLFLESCSGAASSEHQALSGIEFTWEFRDDFRVHSFHPIRQGSSMRLETAQNSPSVHLRWRRIPDQSDVREMCAACAEDARLRAGETVAVRTATVIFPQDAIEKM